MRIVQAGAAIALAVLVVAGCGEKSEPDLGAATEETTTVQNGGQAFDIRGRWDGVLEQKGIGSFGVEATINAPPGKRAGDVRYGGINCRGRWEYLGRRGGAYRYRETITSGAGGECKGSGTVTLKPDKGELEYEFRGGGVVSDGTLERKSGQQTTGG
jgi:hypothetical protein